MLDGRRAVVRNGHLPEQEVLTAVGPVAVQVPKVRDRGGAGMKFNSARVPLYVRRSTRVAAALPWLYLNGVSSGDLDEALAVLVGQTLRGRTGAAEGPVERGLPRLDEAGSDGQALRLLVGQRHLYHLARRRRRPPAVPAGQHRRQRRGEQGVGSHRGWAARVHRPPGWRSCPASRSGAWPRGHVWPSATAPWGSGPPWSRSTPPLVTSAAGFIRWATFGGAAKEPAGQGQRRLTGDLDGPQSRRGDGRTQVLAQALRGQAPEGCRETGEGPRCPAGLYDFPA